MITESHNFGTLRQILTEHCTPSEECIRDFENAAVLCSVARGEAVVRQGEVCDYFVFNRVGLLRVCNVTDGDGGYIAGSERRAMCSRPCIPIIMVSPRSFR